MDVDPPSTARIPSLLLRFPCPSTPCSTICHFRSFICQSFLLSQSHLHSIPSIDPLPLPPLPIHVLPLSVNLIPLLSAFCFPSDVSPIIAANGRARGRNRPNYPDYDWHWQAGWLAGREGHSLDSRPSSLAPSHPIAPPQFSGLSGRA